MDWQPHPSFHWIPTIAALSDCQGCASRVEIKWKFQGDTRLWLHSKGVETLLSFWLQQFWFCSLPRHPWSDHHHWRAHSYVVFHLSNGQETCPVRLKLELFMQKQVWGPRWGRQWWGRKETLFTSNLFFPSIVGQWHQSGTICIYLQILWRSYLTDKVKGFFFFGTEEYLLSHSKAFVLVGPPARPAVQTRARQMPVIIFLLYINFVQYSVWVYQTFR